MNHANSTLIDSITVLLATQIENLSQTKWNKLMFFIDGAYYCLHDKFATEMKYVNLIYGPAPDGYRATVLDMIERDVVKKETYNIAASDAVQFIEPGGKITEAEAREFVTQHDHESNKQDSLFNIVTKIATAFCDWSVSELSTFSHHLKIWKDLALYKKLSEKDFEYLKDDPYLKDVADEGNFGKIIIPSS